MHKDLRSALESGLKQGLSRDTIRSLAKQGGWTEQEIQEAMASFVETELPIAIPVRKPVRFARETYLYLMQITSYVVSAIAFLILWFQYLNIWLPDNITDYSYAQNSARDLIRIGLSMLIVSVPILLLVSRSIRRYEAAVPDAPLNSTKQGALYFGAFVASVVAAVTLMATVYTGLNGEATLRFLLKVLAILLVCGATTWLGRVELKQESIRRKSP